MKFKIVFIFMFFSISLEDGYIFRSMDKLDGSPTDRCLVQDINGISYVKKCKKGKYCQIFKNSNDNSDNQYIQGICVNFKMPLFVDDPCLSNEECLTQNCDDGKCAEQEFCLNDNQCEKGKYCDIHKLNNNTYKCLSMHNEDEDCYSNEECGRFMLCNYDREDEVSVIGKCKLIGNIDSAVKVIINGENSTDNKLDKYLCKSGIIEGDNCSNENYDDYLPLCNSDNKCENHTAIKCKYNPIEKNYYCPIKKQKIAFQKYKSEIDKQNKEMDNDDKMWNWNNNRFHGDKKKLKEYLFYYENPIFTKYNEEYDEGNDDDDAKKVIEFLQQMYLNSKWIKTNIKILFFIITMFLL